MSPHFLLFWAGSPRALVSAQRNVDWWAWLHEHDTDSSKSVSQYLEDLEQDMRNAEKYARVQSTMMLLNIVSYEFMLIFLSQAKQ